MVSDLPSADEIDADTNLLPSRIRKIRCDGAKPVCHSCSHRTTDKNECNYDPAPKRRGPDKMPGARQRMAREVRDQLNNSFLESRRRCRARDAPPDNPSTTGYHHGPLPIPVSLPSDETAIDLTSMLVIPPGVITDVSSLDDTSPTSQPQSNLVCVCHGRLSCLGPVSTSNLFDFPKASSLATL